MQLIYTVPQSHCVVLERFGRFSRIQHDGLQFRIPILEQVRRVDSWGDAANKRRFIIELTEQQTDTPARQTHTKDNVPVTANASVYWRIIDPRKALYEVDVLPKAIADVALNALRSNIGSMELDQALSERQDLNQRIEAQLADTGEKWGIVFTRVEIQELTTDRDVAGAMIQQMDAERRRRAVVAEAEGQAEAEIKIAEAEKQAAILRAEGQARAIVTIAAAEQKYLKALASETNDDRAGEILVAQKYIDGFNAISKNPAHKVFLPNNFGGLFGFDTNAEGLPPLSGDADDAGRAKSRRAPRDTDAPGSDRPEVEAEERQQADTESAGEQDSQGLREQTRYKPTSDDSSQDDEPDKWKAPGP